MLLITLFRICVLSNDFVFEIGPGKGALTDSIVLRRTVATILQFLKRQRTYPILKKFFKPNIEILCGDILKFDLNSYLNNWFKWKG